MSGCTLELESLRDITEVNLSNLSLGKQIRFFEFYRNGIETKLGSEVIDIWNSFARSPSDYIFYTVKKAEKKREMPEFEVCDCCGNPWKRKGVWDCPVCGLSGRS
ncbi:MAG: hypothetical protein ACXABY_01360 [Candidatus Thorarchaeota archaeon]|jgi:rubrerythrin